MIIDTHVHIGTVLNFRMKKEDVLYSMEKYGIGYSIVSDIRAVEFAHNQKHIPKLFQTSQYKCAESVIGFAKDNPDKIGAAVWLKPYGEKADKEITELISRERKYIRALKFHPFHSTVPFDSKEMDPFITIARDQKLPVVTHTGGTDQASCVRVYNMAKRWPDVNFVMVHMGLGTDNSEATELIGKLPNLYGDTTWVKMENTIKFIEKNGDEKIVFGSDNPIDGKDTYLNNGRGSVSIYQDYFHKLPELISPSSYENLMYKNALRIFGEDIVKATPHRDCASDFEHNFLSD